MQFMSKGFENGYGTLTEREREMLVNIAGKLYIKKRSKDIGTAEHMASDAFAAAEAFVLVYRARERGGV